MIGLARILLFLSGTLVISHYLPKVYWLLFAERIRSPHATFSNVKEDFLFYRWDADGVHYEDRAGKAIDRETLEALTPLSSYSQLMADGRMPESLHGVALDVRTIRAARMMARIKPAMLDAPSTGLGRLLESEGRSVRLEMPDDFMRFGARVEFLDPSSNEVIEEKSSLFTEALEEAGFAFPVCLHGGNPTDRKSYDEGYYLMDSEGRVFNLRMARGYPVVTDLALAGRGQYDALWQALKPAHILVGEQGNRELRCMIIDEEGQLWMIVDKDFRPVLIDLEHFDPASTHVTFRGDLFSRTFLVKGEGILEAVALDENYQLLMRYEEVLPTREDTGSGRVFRCLFPWEWELEDSNSMFFDYYVKMGSTWVIALNAVMVLFLLAWKRRSLKADPLGGLMIASVFLGGVFALISYLFTPKPKQS